MAAGELRISRTVVVPLEEIELSAIRAQGAGGQNVNKVASAIHLRFDAMASSLPEAYKQGLLGLQDHRVTRDGIVVIKAQNHRTQAKNREAALTRLQDLLQRAGRPPRRRPPPRPPSRAAKRRRIQGKKDHGRKKALRKPPDD